MIAGDWRGEPRGRAAPLLPSGCGFADARVDVRRSCLYVAEWPRRCSDRSPCSRRGAASLASPPSLSAACTRAHIGARSHARVLDSRAVAVFQRWAVSGCRVGCFNSGATYRVCSLCVLRFQTSDPRRGTAHLLGRVAILTHAARTTNWGRGCEGGGVFYTRDWLPGGSQSLNLHGGTMPWPSWKRRAPSLEGTSRAWN